MQDAICQAQHGCYNHELTALTIACTEPVQEWASKQWKSTGREPHKVLLLPAELLDTDGPWERHSHYLRLSTCG